MNPNRNFIAIGVVNTLNVTMSTMLENVIIVADDRVSGQVGSS